MGSAAATAWPWSAHGRRGAPRRKLDHQAASTRCPLSVAGRDLHLAADHGNPRPLVYLVTLQALARRDLEHDGASFVAGGEDLRRVGAQLDRPQGPAPTTCAPLVAARDPSPTAFHRSPRKSRVVVLSCIVHAGPNPSTSIRHPARSASLGTKSVSRVAGSSWSSRPRVSPRCRAQTTGWFSRTASR
jgi:hypothetical protein